MPGPWRSKLTKYQSKIAELRSKIPPTPYVEIARILNEKPYELGITAGSIWAFVKARDPRRAKKVFKLPDQEPTRPTEPQPAETVQEFHARTKTKIPYSQHKAAREKEEQEARSRPPETKIFDE